MKANKQVMTGLLYATCIMVMILDTKTAVRGAIEGVDLCLYTVFPSLYPFILLSILLNSYLMGSKIGILRPIGKLCGIPSGSEGLLIPAFLGGYPVGAQGIADAWNSGSLNNRDAKRMLGFCNNAGPAFIFGITSGLFFDPIIPWILWFIHITSAIITGILLPNKSHSIHPYIKHKPLSFISALKKSIHTMVEICIWIIIFRIILAFATRWILWILPDNVMIFAKGILELTNGCISAKDMHYEGAKFVYISVFLGFGGLCVTGQTLSVTKGLGIGYYFPGKVIQASISFILAFALQNLLFSQSELLVVSGSIRIVVVLLPIFVTVMLNFKKIVAIQKRIIYNNKKTIS